MFFFCLKKLWDIYADEYETYIYKTRVHIKQFRWKLSRN